MILEISFAQSLLEYEVKTISMQNIRALELSIWLQSLDRHKHKFQYSGRGEEIFEYIAFPMLWDDMRERERKLLSI